jgi:pyridoxamine 5'-phosphate oxidase
MNNPLQNLARWIDEAREAEVPAPAAMTLATASSDGQPSARIVSLKRIEDDALLFTSALWTRKAREMAANPRVALLFHWPSLGRQAHLSGEATLAERTLAEELFAERDPAHQLQTIVSRQGEQIADLAPLRDRLAHLAQAQETAPRCPEDWGALRVRPDTIELWSEAADRLHERRLFERTVETGWSCSLLAP